MSSHGLCANTVYDGIIIISHGYVQVSGSSCGLGGRCIAANRSQTALFDAAVAKEGKGLHHHYSNDRSKGLMTS
jgi:hypothetical protein